MKRLFHSVVRYACPKRLMDPYRFLNALGDFLSRMAAGHSVNALTSLWNRSVGQAINTIAPCIETPRERLE